MSLRRLQEFHPKEKNNSFDHSLPSLKVTSSHHPSNWIQRMSNLKIFERSRRQIVSASHQLMNSFRRWVMRPPTNGAWKPVNGWDINMKYIPSVCRDTFSGPIRRGGAAEGTFVCASPFWAVFSRRWQFSFTARDLYLDGRKMRLFHPLKADPSRRRKLGGSGHGVGKSRPTV